MSLFTAPYPLLSPVDISGGSVKRFDAEKLSFAWWVDKNAPNAAALAQRLPAHHFTPAPHEYTGTHFGALFLFALAVGVALHVDGN